MSRGLAEVVCGLHDPVVTMLEKGLGLSQSTQIGTEGPGALVRGWHSSSFLDNTKERLGDWGGAHYEAFSTV